MSGSRPIGGNRPRGVYVPPNYSGTALGQESTPTPSFDDLPQVSNLPAQRESLSQEETSLASTALEQDGEEAFVHPEGSPPSGLGGLPGGHKFPFGHGIGYEELFLLGLLLFLGKEADTKESDDLPLTLLLVGGLLFCG